jgi:hypothetical protein
MSDAQTSIELVQPVAVTRESPRARGRSGKKKHVAGPRSEIQLLGAIDAKLDRIVAVLAAGQARDRDQQVRILAAADCDSTFVGAFVNLAPGRVRQLDAWLTTRQNSGEDEG